MGVKRFDVTAGVSGVDFFPNATEAEILQNVRTILATRRGSVPLDRAFGVSWDMIDKPLPVARAMMISDIVETVSKYEPRASVKGVTFSGSDADALDGVLRPSVTIEFDEGSSDAQTSYADSVPDSSASSAEVAGASSAADSALAAAETAVATARSAMTMAAAVTADVEDIESRLSSVEDTDYAAAFEGGAE